MHKLQKKKENAAVLFKGDSAGHYTKWYIDDICLKCNRIQGSWYIPVSCLYNQYFVLGQNVMIKVLVLYNKTGQNWRCGFIPHLPQSSDRSFSNFLSYIRKKWMGNPFQFVQVVHGLIVWALVIAAILLWTYHSWSTM